MHYLIDGYNLLFRILHKGNDLQSQRQHLIHELHTKIRELKLEVTIVFDSFYQKGESTRSHFKELEIIYTAEGESADEYIIEDLKGSLNPREEIVVTSDTELGRRARRCLAKLESVEEFIKKLNSRYRRHQKLMREAAAPPEELPPQKKMVKKEKTTKPEEAPSPTTVVTAEECFDYYLEVFQKQWETEAEVQEKKKAASRDKKPLVKVARKKGKRAVFETEAEQETKAGSDMERWLEIFNKKLKDD